VTAAVDTNILLDILLPDPQFRDESRAFIERGMKQGAIVICETVYSELSTFFMKKRELDAFLEDLNITLKSSTRDSLFKAGEAWKEYLRTIGSTGSLQEDPDIQCTACGNRMKINCTECGQSLTKRHILSDFIIGAHANALADTLITRDRGIYKGYFKDLTLNFGD
jgi:predicted nucleic acid-binding protein